MVVRGGKSGRLTASKQTVEQVERRAGGSRVVRRAVTEEVVWTPCGKHAGQTRFDRSIARGRLGSVSGPEHDLSPDDTFRGETVAVLQLRTGEELTLAEPTAALRRKGFKVLRWASIPAPAKFEAGLKRSCQLWVISGDGSVLLPAAHLALIRGLVEARKGLLIWADNDPLTAAASQILAALPETRGLTLSGNYHADKVLSEASGAGPDKGAGFTKHLSTTGIEQLYEGITVAALAGPSSLRRVLIRSSGGAVVTACHDRDNKRILIDGGFTRLHPDRWDRAAGAARFVTNTACWLYNFEGKNHRRPGGGGNGGGDEGGRGSSVASAPTPRGAGAERAARGLARLIAEQPGRSMPAVNMAPFYARHPEHRGLAKKALCTEHPGLLRWVEGASPGLHRIIAAAAGRRRG